jgi:hypothetical protein
MQDVVKVRQDSSLCSRYSFTCKASFKDLSKAQKCWTCHIVTSSKLAMPNKMFTEHFDILISCACRKLKTFMFIKHSIKTVYEAYKSIDAV